MYCYYGDRLSAKPREISPFTKGEEVETINLRKLINKRPWTDSPAEKRRGPAYH